MSPGVRMGLGKFPEICPILKIVRILTQVVVYTNRKRRKVRGFYVNQGDVAVEEDEEDGGEEGPATQPDGTNSPTNFPKLSNF